MPHNTDLIATITLALAFAFGGGFVAVRLHLPPIAGYLLAGVALGPFTPGYVADAAVASQLAEIGIVLLMFGVGIHFSLRDLVAVRSIALPGAIVQGAVATLLGIGAAAWWGWSFGAGLVLGLAVSIASTVVLLRVLIDRNLLDSIHGRIAVGWLIVEDLFTVILLVLLPALADPLRGGETGLAAALGSDVLLALALALGKAAIFAVLMFVVGARVIPHLLVQVARTGSRELFTLAVLTIALGIAFGATTLFGISLALGAFIAGTVISESDLSHQAAADALPLRDAFAVLFFVSVGMLFDPAFLLTAPLQVLTVLGIILVANPLMGFLIVFAFGYPLRTALIVGAALAQIGEFSFILAELGHRLGIFPDAGRQIILAGAIFSILLNPLMFRAIEPINAWVYRHAKIAAFLARWKPGGLTIAPVPPPHPLQGHAVLCGYGHVGSIIGEALERRGFRYIVVEQDRYQVEALRRRGIFTVFGDAANPMILEHLRLAQARAMVVALPDPIAVRQIVEYARRVSPKIDIVVRTQRGEDVQFLQDHGVSETVIGDLELALEMTRHILHRFGVDARESQALLQTLRLRGVEQQARR